MFRKVAVVVAAPLLFATACAEGTDGAIEVRTGAEAVSALRAAPDAVTDAGTAAFEAVMEITADGEVTEVEASGSIDAQSRRMAMRLDMGPVFEQMAAAAGEEVPEGFAGAWEMVADGGTFYMRAPMFEMLGVQGWISMTPEDLGMGSGAMGLGAGAYDLTKTLESLRGVVGEPDVVGEETVRGVPTVHYAAEMALDEALARVPEAQRAAVEAQLEQLGDLEGAAVPVDVWIDEDDLPRRMRMDMGSMFGSFGVSDLGATMTMELFDYGEPVDIVVPSAHEVTTFREAMAGFGGGGS